MFIEILFKMLLFKGGVLIYAEHCMYIWCVVFMSLCRTGVLELHSHTLLVFRHACDVFDLLFQFLPVCVCVVLSVFIVMFVFGRCLGVTVSTPAYFFREPLKLLVVQLTFVKC